MGPQNQEKRTELRAFDSINSRGFLLFKRPYQESDLIVDILLEQGLRISALVRGGQKSIKRFGGRLEALQLLQFQVRAPRGSFSFENLFSLEGVDVVEIFSGFRSSWQGLNEGLFYIELFRDLFVKGDLEAWVYPAFSRLLLITNELSADKDMATWRKVYLWSYFAYRLGFGFIGETGLFNALIKEHFELWKKIHLEEVFSENAIRLLSELFENSLDKPVLRDLYSDWIGRSHLKCRSIESILV